MTAEWALHDGAFKIATPRPGHDSYAQTNFRRTGSAPSAKDAAPALLEAIVKEARKVLAGAESRRVLADLEGKAKVQSQRLETCRQRLADLKSRREAPGLLDAPDLAGALRDLDREREAIQAQQADAEKALGVLAPAVQQARNVLYHNQVAAVREILRRRQTEASAPRAGLLEKLAAAAAPLLEQLVAVEADIAALALPGLVDQALAALQEPRAGTAAPAPELVGAH